VSWLGVGPRWTIPVELTVLLSLILLNGVFSGAEIAILSMRRTRLQELVEEGNGGAVAVEGLRADPERFLATVQVGITLVSAAAAAFGGSSIAARIVPLFELVPALAPFAERLSLVLVVLLVSYLSLVLGELVPKSLALRAGERYALLIGRPLGWLAWVARPVVWALRGSSNVVLKLFGDSTSFVESRLSAAELRQLVDEAATGGTLDPKVGEIATRAFDFGELLVKAIMIPRNQIVAVPREVTLEAFAGLVRARGHARVLVYGTDLEDIQGVVVVRDVLAQAAIEGKLSFEGLLHPVPFVPTTMGAPGLLRDLQARQLHLALVVDEQGLVRGLVTLEDLLEELVGEILSEGDVPESKAKREPDGSILAAGSLAIHEVNRAFGLELPEGETFSTLAGLCMSIAEQIPTKGTRLEVEGYELEVVDASNRRVKSVKIRSLSAS
jgi:putative hemolysin